MQLSSITFFATVMLATAVSAVRLPIPTPLIHILFKESLTDFMLLSVLRSRIAAGAVEMVGPMVALTNTLDFPKHPA